MSLRSIARLHLLANHFPPLHGLRAIAIISVLQFHLSVTFRAGGLLTEDHPLLIASQRLWFGMDLFFVLSGFLIGMLLESSTNAARGGMLRFYARRTFRIVPLYWFVLTVIVLLFPPMPGPRANLLYEYAYLSNYFPPSVLPWGWSLCVEEHFYLVVPILAAALARLPRPSWRMGVLFALWLAALGVRYVVFASRAGPWTHDTMLEAIYTRTHTRFDTLVAGVLLAQVHAHYGKEVRSALERPSVVVALVVVSGGCFLGLLGPLADRYDLTTIFSWGTITSVMYFALCLLLIGSTSFVSRFLSSRAFLRFATLGYGMYLLHPPLTLALFPAAIVMRYYWHLPIVLVWILALMLLVLTSAAGAYLLHLVVEKPALWLRDRVAR